MYSLVPLLLSYCTAKLNLTAIAP